MYITFNCFLKRISSFKLRPQVQLCPANTIIMIYTANTIIVIYTSTNNTNRQEKEAKPKAYKCTHEKGLKNSEEKILWNLSVHGHILRTQEIYSGLD
jgi:hypothetical protein